MSSSADGGLQVAERMPVALLLQDPPLLEHAGVAERGAEEEAVELRLGQRERSLVLDRVLGREQEERARQLAGLAVDGHLPFRHRLEQRRLGLRRRPVDLVDEQDVGEDRARPELEVARLLVEDGHAGDVGRLQVGRALDPRDRDALDAAADRAREHRLRGPGHVLEQHVAAAHQRGEDELDLLALAVDDGLDVVEQARRDVDRGREALGLFLDAIDPGFHRRRS